MSDAFTFNPDGSVRIIHANDIGTAIAAAIDEAAERKKTGQGEELRFTFNGTTVVARGDSNPELLYRDWHRHNSGRIPLVEGHPDVVGPYPEPTLSEETLRLEAAVQEAEQRLREAKGALHRHLALSASRS